jgi:hypothetical protein
MKIFFYVFTIPELKKQLPPLALSGEAFICTKLGEKLSKSKKLNYHFTVLKDCVILQKNKFKNQ